MTSSDLKEFVYIGDDLYRVGFPIHYRVCRQRSNGVYEDTQTMVTGN